jgi:hypothetical protein
VLLRRRLASVFCAAAALLPAVFWLAPTLVSHEAPSFRDQGDFFYPLKLYTADRLRAGEVPLWNPLSGTGEPWLANGQSGVFYPPDALFLLPSAALAGGLFLLLHFAIAVWGARRFLKEESVSEAGALVGAAVFAASGFAASLSAYWNHFGAWAYLPAIAAVCRGGLRSRASVLGLAALVGLQAMAGSPEMSAASLILGAALAWSPRAEFPEPLVAMPRGVALRRFGAGTGLGLALAAWVLFPMAELAVRSDRRHALPPAERDYGALSPGALASAAGFSLRQADSGYVSSVFVPAFVLVAAAAGFREPHRRRLALALLVFALAGALVAMSGPPGSWLRSLPPLDRLRYPAKGLAWTVFGLAALAGLGIDGLRFAPGGVRGRTAFGLLSLGALAAAAVSAVPFPLRLAGGVGSAALGLLALGAGRRPAAGAFLASAAGVALVGALALGLEPLQRFVPEAALRRCPDAVAALSRTAGRIVTPPMGELWMWTLRDDRFDTGMIERQREALLGYTNLLCRVPTVRTAAALRTAGAEAIEKSIGPAEDAMPAGAASGRVLWTPFPPARLPSRKIGDFFRAPLAPYRPRLSFLRSYRLESDPGRAWARIAAGEVDLTREVLLDRRPDPGPGDGEARPLLLARLAEDRPEEVAAEVTSNQPGLLVLTDLDYPGWIAEEGGRRLPILRADGYFRAVALPAGTHRVVFRYRPLSFYAGAAVSALALLTILVLWHSGEPAGPPVWRRAP